MVLNDGVLNTAALNTDIVSAPDIFGIAQAMLTIPAPLITATANGDDNAQVAITIPAPLITARTGAVASLPVPSPSLTATGTVQVFAAASLEIPAPELTATAASGTLAQIAIELPAPTLTAFTGAYASLAVLAPKLTASGSVDHLARVALTLPFLELTATAKVGAVATVSLSVPAPTLEVSGMVGAVAQVALTLPALILTATDVATVTESTYAINLNTGAVTNLLLGAFNRLVTAHGKLYGLRNDELICLTGDTDAGQPIPATVRLAPQTFGSNHPKRMSAVYLSSREDDGLTLTVVADEVAQWRYQTATDTAPAYGTHKIKVGRGVKFHTAGLIVQNRNGGRMDIGGIELLVDTGSPRPKS